MRSSVSARSTEDFQGLKSAENRPEIGTHCHVVALAPRFYSV